MKRNKLTTHFAPALLLFAAALGMAGCSQSDDTPVSAGVARGGEPLHIRIAPKTGFADGIGTRATTADDGTFTWQDYDKLFVSIEFNDPGSTRRLQTWYRGYESAFIPDWLVESDWTTSPVADMSALVWPVGASTATVKAFYTDCAVTVNQNGGVTSGLTIGYGAAANTGDHMFFEETVTIGNDLTVELRHTTTRFVFTGVPANASYTLGVTATNQNLGGYLESLSVDFDQIAEHAQTFRSNADGKLVICADVSWAVADGKLSLHLNGAAGSNYHVNTELTAPAPGIQGYTYTVNVKEILAGGIDPDTDPDLLPQMYNGQPATLLAIPGFQAYWVAPVNAVTNTTWGNINYNTACPEGWRVPTRSDFLEMIGLTEPGYADKTIHAAVTAAFPENKNYWSSTPKDNNDVYVLVLGDSESQNVNLTSVYKYNEYNVRCVRPK